MLYVKKIEGADSDGDEEEGTKEVSIEQILSAGLSRGLRMQDAENMTLGMWVDYIIECNNMEWRQEQKEKKKEKEKTHRRRATQADFDRF